MKWFWLSGFLLIVPAFADDCPVDRPFKRTVADYTKPVTCTLLACIGKLICPDDGDKLSGAECYYGPATDCNKCTGGGVTEICLSAAELEKAR